MHETSRESLISSRGAASQASPPPPSDWCECLRMVDRLTSDHSREIEHVLKLALEAAQGSQVDAGTAEEIAKCLEEAASDGAGRTRVRALRLLQGSPPDGALTLSLGPTGQRYLKYLLSRSPSRRASRSPTAS